VLIAFVIVFLIMLLGLVIDSVRLYVLYVQAQRTAEAGALAGVIYMPTYFNTAAIDGNSATSRACAETAKNGVPCAAAAGLVGAWPSTVTGKPYDLMVTVTLAANNFFLTLLDPSLATSTVSASSTAEFLPSVQLGSRQTYFGDPTQGDKFYAAMDGPQDLKEWGDALTPTTEEGNSDPVANADGWPWDGRTVTAPYTTSYGKYTNHPQKTGWPIPNPNQQPPGFTGQDGVLGYTYEIDVPDTMALPVQVQIYNPRYDPGNPCISSSPCTTYPYVATNDHFQGWENVFPNCSTLAQWNTQGSNRGSDTCHFNSSTLYMTMSYSLYKVQLSFERAVDQPIASVSYAPLDTLAYDLKQAGCATDGTQVFDFALNACEFATRYPDLTSPWTTVATITQTGTYRLTIDAGTIGYGSKQYSVKLNPAASDPNLRIFAWNDMCVIFQAPNGGSGTLDQAFDLGNVPASYAGHTLDFSLYDPGDANAHVYMRVLDPSGNSPPLPSWVIPITIAGQTWIDASYYRYNGLTLNLPIAISKTYTGGWWQVEYRTDSASGIDDKITIAISLKGNPLHLVG